MHFVEVLFYDYFFVHFQTLAVSMANFVEDGPTVKIKFNAKKNQKVTSPSGSQLVPHASTKKAKHLLTSQFGMRYGTLSVVWT